MLSMLLSNSPSCRAVRTAPVHAALIAKSGVYNANGLDKSQNRDEKGRQHKK